MTKTSIFIKGGRLWEEERRNLFWRCCTFCCTTDDSGRLLTDLSNTYRCSRPNVIVELANSILQKRKVPCGEQDATYHFSEALLTKDPFDKCSRNAPVVQQVTEGDGTCSVAYDAYFIASSYCSIPGQRALNIKASSAAIRYARCLTGMLNLEAIKWDLNGSVWSAESF